jgi:hypothetical protein
MQRNEKVRVSNHTLLQRFAKESNEKQKLAKNLKTAGSNPLGVRVPRSRQARVLARISGRLLPAATLADCVESLALRCSRQQQPSADSCLHCRVVIALATASG